MNLETMCSVNKSCPTLYDPMDCNVPGFPVLHRLPEFAQTHVIESVMPSNHLILCHPLLLLPSIFPSIRVFSNESARLFTSGDQSIGASASATVHPMTSQGWFPLGLTSLISLQSKEFSRVFSKTPDQKHQFFGAQLFIVQLSHSYMTTGKTIALTRWTFVGKVVSAF